MILNKSTKRCFDIIDTLAKGGVFRGKDLAEPLGIDKVNIMRVIRGLEAISRKKGPGGGIELTGQVTYLEVVESVGGQIDLAGFLPAESPHREIFEHATVVLRDLLNKPVILEGGDAGKAA